TALGYGDTFIGISPAGFGSLKVGTVYSPYKKSTDRLNPFSGHLGDYASIIGNSGGDNRVEFGTRLEHSIWYESPKIAGMVNVDFLWSPGQNRTYDSIIQSGGASDCSGGNVPGSGNLPLNCDDGAFQDALSADIRVEVGGLYVTGAIEWHDRVNRNSDGIGNNNPLSAYYAINHPNGVIGGPTLDPTFNNPQDLPAQALGAYVDDIGPETAMKVAAQYVFDFGFSIGGLFEALRRNIPSELNYQNERQRNGTWLTATQKVGVGSVSVGWAHATRTAGDPGGQHNYNPNATNTADMVTATVTWHFDKSLMWYADFADTMNNGNAHFDIGAGGRGLTTDCHDATSIAFIDYSSNGPTTWGGCNIVGFGTGLNYKF
ncbi:MAG TPA: porin, partial [Myxococcales bacterium]|nr:porin [Myxococcales bacterium]